MANAQTQNPLAFRIIRLVNELKNGYKMSLQFFCDFPTNLNEGTSLKTQELL